MPKNFKYKCLPYLMYPLLISFFWETYFFRISVLRIILYKNYISISRRQINALTISSFFFNDIFSRITYQLLTNSFTENLYGILRTRIQVYLLSNLFRSWTYFDYPKAIKKMHPKSGTHNLRDFKQFFTATSNKVRKFWHSTTIQFNIFMFPALVGSCGTSKWKQMASAIAKPLAMTRATREVTEPALNDS